MTLSPDSFDNLDSIYKLDPSLQGPFFADSINEILANCSADEEECFLHKCSTIFNKLKDSQEFLESLKKVDAQIYDFFATHNCDWWFDKEKLKKEIDEHDVISFDCFDTLLIRPFPNQFDPLVYLEMLTGLEGFTNARIERWNIARNVCFAQKQEEDCSLEYVYRLLPPKYYGMLKLEKDFEKQTCQANSEMKEVYQYALQKSKKIIITTDTSYDSKYISELLKEKGFTSISKVFASSEIKKTKVTGNLYKYVLKDLKVKSDQILHIGSTINDSFYYKSCFKRFEDSLSNQPIIKYYDNLSIGQKNYFCSIFGIILESWHQLRNKRTSVAERIGCFLGGPMSFSFCQEVHNVVLGKDLSDLFFNARDSFLFKWFYEYLYPECKDYCHYVYAQRKLRNYCINDNSDYNSDLEHEYSKYINSIKVHGKNIGLVDSNAYSYSAQQLIEFYRKDLNVLGLYVYISPKYKYNFLNLSGQNALFLDPRLTPFFEFIFTSEECSVIAIKNQRPVYKPKTAIETARISKFKEVENGVKYFASQVKTIFGNCLLDGIVANTTELSFKYLVYWWENRMQFVKQFCSQIEMLDDMTGKLMKFE